MSAHPQSRLERRNLDEQAKVSRLLCKHAHPLGDCRACENAGLSALRARRWSNNATNPAAQFWKGGRS